VENSLKVVKNTNLYYSAGGKSRDGEELTEEVGYS